MASVLPAADAQRLHRVRQDLQRGCGVPARKPFQHAFIFGAMLYAAPVQPATGDFEARVHGFDVRGAGGRPESFSDNGPPRPQPGIDGFFSYILAPHACFTTEDVRGFFWGQLTRFATERVHVVMKRGRIHVIQVITVRKNPAVAFACGVCKRLLAAPRLNYRVGCQARTQNFIPTNHFLSMFAEDGLQPLVEICVQFAAVLQSVLLAECLNGGVMEPLCVQHFVAADVEVFVWKQGGHLSDEAV